MWHILFDIVLTCVTQSPVYERIPGSSLDHFSLGLYECHVYFSHAKLWKPVVSRF
jgi:hypothetical protein